MMNQILFFFWIQACTNGHLIGDGFCDDETNNPECIFDGGDCCGPCVVATRCLNCTCLQTDVNVGEIKNHLVGDGYCNDETNSDACGFDGGDCCGPCINTEFCSECQCHLGNLSKLQQNKKILKDLIKESDYFTHQVIRYHKK